MKVYKTVYPLYVGEKIKQKIIDDFELVEGSEGFIGLGTCNYNIMGKHFDIMLAYNTAENREKAGLRIQFKGYDMSDIAVSKPVELKNPLPVFNDYKKDPLYSKQLHESKKTYNDKIVITHNQLYKILDCVQVALSKRRLLLSDLYSLKELPLPVVSIVLGNKQLNFSANAKEGTVIYEMYLENNRFYKVLMQPRLYEEKVEVENAIKVMYQSPTFLHNEFKHADNLLLFLAINYFIKNIPSSYHKTTTKQVETICEGKGINKRYKQVVRLRSHYSFAEVDKMTKTHINHIFTCLCWGVRGHFRHYKDGKTVFIQPYKKGKERNNLEAFSGKEYQL